MCNLKVKIPLKRFVLNEVVPCLFHVCVKPSCVPCLFLVMQQVEPEAYASIFQNSLEPDILNQILNTLHGFYIK